MTGGSSPRSRFARASWAALLGACSIARAVHAEGAPTVEGAPVAERGSDWYVSDSLDFRGALRPAVGLLGDWSYGALTGRAGPKGPAALTDRVMLRAGGTLVLADQFRVGVQIPLVLFDHTDRTSRFASSAPALGDLRLSASARLAGTFDDPATLAIGLRAYLPTGSRDDAMSDGTLRVEPQLLFAGRVRSLVYAATLGAQVRPRRETFEGREFGSEASFSVALGVKVNDRIVLGPELFGHTTLRHEAFSARATPLEVLLGGHLRVTDALTIGTSIGTRLTRADLAPTLRVLAVVDFTPDYCVDRDGDGICATVDACPEADGPASTDPKKHGCPLDSDGDGVLDREDACPFTPGVRSTAPEERGCPPRSAR